MPNDLHRLIALLEGTTDDLLFHSTTVDGALRIIASQSIRATPTHVGHDQGVSLTRSFDFAKYWRDGVVFVFDQNKLDNHLVPMRWRPHHGETDPGDEQETFAYGSLPLDDALISITIGNPSKISASKHDTPERAAALDMKLRPLLTHPKINRWQPAPTSRHPLRLGANPKR